MNQAQSLKRSIIALMVATAPTCSAFTAPTSSTFGLIRHHQVLRTQTSLYSYAISNEDEAMMMMMKANTCAHSDTCSIDEAEDYLKEMLHLQSNCASGSLTSDLICEDVIFPSEVIAGLREKIQKHTELR